MKPRARASAVGIDLDEVPVSAIHSRATALQRPVQALVVDLSQPTPASGWRNEERRSFFDCAVGRFDIALLQAIGTIEMRENLHNGRTLFWVQAKPVQQG